MTPERQERRRAFQQREQCLEGGGKLRGPKDATVAEVEKTMSRARRDDVGEVNGGGGYHARLWRPFILMIMISSSKSLAGRVTTMGGKET